MSNKLHAKLSASGAHRWLVCPRSIGLEEMFEEETTVFAEEGSLAHDLAELRLKQELGKATREEVESWSKEHKIPTEMKHYVEGYVNYCLELYMQEILASEDVTSSVEERLNFEEWVPGGFGTGDFLILSQYRIIVVDFKYGKGVEVSAENNPQTRLYGLGAYSEYGWIYPATEVQMHIYQPRINNISVEVLSLEELLEYGETIKPRALMADSGEGEYNPGPHCKFCKARATCRARSNYILENINKLIGKKED